MSKELINLDTFNADFSNILAKNEMFQESTKHGRKCINELKDRLIEHVKLIHFIPERCYWNFLLTHKSCFLFPTSYANLEHPYYCHVLFSFTFKAHEWATESTNKSLRGISFEVG